MRTIKFRAWNNKIEIMLDKFPFCEHDPFMNLNTIWSHCEKNKLNRLTDIVLMQFTGLCDKNGKEIYEGDILKVVEDDEYKGKEIVEWNNKMTGFDPFIDYAVMSICPISGSGVYPSDCEVIGNIHQNPELLK